jgi:nitronate monooxygenase/enoyl-[acyl-carrier protein] reductase II
LAKARGLTNRPFAVNHTFSPGPPNPEAFELTLQAKPRLVSFALGDPGEYVKRVHDAGILVMHQVTTVQQAYRAAERGVDIVVAQGSESGGFGGTVAGLALIPQVVDAIRPVPVIAAGGIADGRGLAAALVMGAQGINIGTRFLASVESPISADWKQAILSAESQDAIKAEFWSDIFPTGATAYPVVPRVLSSPFIEEWQNRRGDAGREAEQLQRQVGNAIAQGTFGEMFPFTGQTAGMIREILPAAEIVRRLVVEAEAAFRRATSVMS